MQMIQRRWLALSGLYLIFAFALGCSADIKKPNEVKTEEENQTDPPPTNEDPENEEPDRVAQLECVKPCSQSGTPASISFHPDDQQKQADISVRYSYSDGTPIDGKNIKFQFRNNQPGMTLSSDKVTTDDNGVATATLDATGATPGHLRVIVSAPKEDIESLEWSVTMEEETKAPYRVNVNYSGAQTIDPVIVKLYPKGDFTCEMYRNKFAKLRAGETYSSPVSSARSQKKQVSSNQFPTQIVFDEVENGSSYTVVVEGKSNSHTSATVASGCQYETPVMEDAEPVEVDVDMLDHLPRAAAKYNVNHTFDMRGGLPDSIETLANLLARMTTDPGSFFLGCPQNPAADSICSNMPGEPGLIGILLDILPQDSSLRSTIETVLSIQPVNAALRTAIDNVANNWLQNNAPDWVNKAGTISGDIHKSLRSFDVEGTLNIQELKINRTESKATIPEKTGTQTWNTFYVEWSGGCPSGNSQSARDCRRRQFGPGTIGTSTDAITGEFGGEITKAKYLAVNKHSLNISYGAIAMSIAEQVILPSMFGQSCGPNEANQCNTIEKSLKALIDCEALARRVTGVQSAQNSLQTFCNQTIDRGAQRVRNYLAEQMMVGKDKIKLQTNSDSKCRLYHPDSYPDSWGGQPLGYTQYIGQKEPVEQKCSWNVDFNIPDYQKQIDGSFYGERATDMSAGTEQ